MDKIYEITLPNGYYAYARYTLRSEYLFVFDLRVKGNLTDVEIICQNEILFVVFPTKRAINSWKYVGEISPDKYSLQVPEFFTQDEFDITRCEIYNEFGDKRDATIEECEGLECVAVWDKEHIESRINDYYSGVQNRIVEELKLKRPNG